MGLTREQVRLSRRREKTKDWDLEQSALESGEEKRNQKENWGKMTIEI